MTAKREFLARVRQAVHAGNRAGAAALPSVCLRSGANPHADEVQRFCSELAAAGGKSHVVDRPEEIVVRVLDIIASCHARRILLSDTATRWYADLGPGDLPAALAKHSLVVTPAAAKREALFQADLGISLAKHLVAETGTVVLTADPDEPRSVSLLPPVHIVLAHKSAILPDLFDLFALFEPGQQAVPSCLTLITGPSKTGDIELKLVTGVHGPGQVHVILGTW